MTKGTDILPLIAEFHQKKKAVDAAVAELNAAKEVLYAEAGVRIKAYQDVFRPVLEKAEQLGNSLPQAYPGEWCDYGGRLVRVYENSKSFQVFVTCSSDDSGEFEIPVRYLGSDGLEKIQKDASIFMERMERQEREAQAAQLSTVELQEKQLLQELIAKYGVPSP